MLTNTLFPNREVAKIQLMNITLAVLVVALQAVDRDAGAHMAVLVATTMLATTLIPARLLGLPWLKRAEPELLKVAYQGKWLGIWTCLWFVMYAWFALVAYFDAPRLSELLTREMVLLTASLVIFVGLLTLSNKWSYAHVKWWKQINMLIWLIVPFVFVHLVLAANVFEAGDFWAAWTILGVCAVAGLSGILRTKRDYFAFHRLGLLVVGLLLSALVVWFYPAIL